ncbi:uncharacterized protein VTP21DRAFT_533 [Calcarisporiella thermophila]|uniref:uncharacterized protein n=1 Tax=Calcarisporiella thermophila TaxID=911321 RepID=UPI0037426ED5
MSLGRSSTLPVNSKTGSTVTYPRPTLALVQNVDDTPVERIRENENSSRRKHPPKSYTTHRRSSSFMPEGFSHHFQDKESHSHPSDRIPRAISKLGGDSLEEERLPAPTELSCLLVEPEENTSLTEYHVRDARYKEPQRSAVDTMANRLEKGKEKEGGEEVGEEKEEENEQSVGIAEKEEEKDIESEKEKNEMKYTSKVEMSNGTAMERMGSVPREPFKTIVKKLHRVNKLTIPAQREAAKRKLHVVSNSIDPFFVGALYVPFHGLLRDSQGRKPPPVLFEALQLAITDSIIDQTSHYRQYIFRIELKYGDVKWVLRKTLVDFIKLHTVMTVKSFQEDIPSLPHFPSQLAHAYHSVLNYCYPYEEDVRAERKARLALQRRKSLEIYLMDLLKLCHRRALYDLCEFLEISALGITKDMGFKGKEGYLESRVGYLRSRCCGLRMNRNWTREWVLLRDSYIGFCTSIGDNRLSDVFLFDKNFSIDYDSDNVFGKQIYISNKYRRIQLKCDSSRELEDWTQSINQVLNSPWVKSHRFDSFAPMRKAITAKWYIDGKDYFYSVSEAILSAKYEIYIAGWWISPEFYLRRPPKQNEQFRLDRLLKRKAEEGVMIYILVYKEMTYALSLDSTHTKAWLQSLHKNIIVQRHPDHGPEGVMFWAHHEKIVVVDCRIAFIGGLDLCFGRYDSHAHHLADYHPDNPAKEIWVGQDYSNPRIKDFVDVIKYDTSLIDRSLAPRMPWHDVAVSVVGKTARDIARHFVQRWNFIKAEKGMQRTVVPFLTPKGEFVSTRDETRFHGTCRVQVLRSAGWWSNGTEREHSIYNAYVALIREAKHFIYIENQFFVSASHGDPRYTLKNRIAEALFERIKQAETNGTKFRVIILVPLIPAFESDLRSPDAGTVRTVMHWQYVSISRGGMSLIERLRQAGIDPDKYIGFFSLRSHDRIGSVRQAQSQHLSQIQLDDTLSEAITPPNSTTQLQPDEEGIGAESPVTRSPENTADIVTEQLYIHSKLMIVDDQIVIVGSANLNDRSQLGNRDSEIAVVIHDDKKVTTLLDNKPYEAAEFAHTLRCTLFQEHLGLLANPELNDPTTSTVSSQLPIATDTLKTPTPSREIKEYLMDYSCTQKDNEGYELVQDILSDEFYTLWRSIADKNTEIFRDIFRCVPDDTVLSWTDYDGFVPDMKTKTGHVADSKRSEDEIAHQLGQIRGHLVNYPTEFLKNENLIGSIVKEITVPMIIFT